MYDQAEWGKVGQFEILRRTHTHLHYTLVQEDQVCIFFTQFAIPTHSRV
jgi:hypothetical protein